MLSKFYLFIANSPKRRRRKKMLVPEFNDKSMTCTQIFIEVNNMQIPIWKRSPFSCRFFSWKGKWFQQFFRFFSLLMLLLLFLICQWFPYLQFVTQQSPLIVSNYASFDFWLVYTAHRRLAKQYPLMRRRKNELKNCKDVLH